MRLLRMENNKNNIYNDEQLFGKPCAELSLLKLCHGEKECHVMEQLRGDIASSRPMLTKGCCKGNNYEQRFALDTFPADFSWRNVDQIILLCF